MAAAATAIEERAIDQAVQSTEYGFASNEKVDHHIRFRQQLPRDQEREAPLRSSRLSFLPTRAAAASVTSPARRAAWPCLCTVACKASACRENAVFGQNLEFPVQKKEILYLPTIGLHGLAELMDAPLACSGAGAQPGLRLRLRLQLLDERHRVSRDHPLRRHRRFARESRPDGAGDRPAVVHRRRVRGHLLGAQRTLCQPIDRLALRGEVLGRRLPRPRRPVCVPLRAL